ncbi:MAG TPA: hypothetical protein DEP57_03890, partial [Selenomonas sp.]|nr:hypothetical protein [Selenomonas sp.]
MKKKLILMALFVVTLTAFQHILHPVPASSPIPLAEYPEKKIVLVPLDGRPPCRQFVIDAGHIGAFDVNVPPSALQDYYSMPGDTAGMRTWLKEQLPGSHAAIISIDQLLYGGLLAARERELGPGDLETLMAFLREIHQANPDIPIYAFSILPRLSPQDTIDGYAERRDIMKYSRLVGKKAAGLPVDDEEIKKLAESIPPKSLETYLAHFEKNKLLNERLAELAAEGVLSRLILGQDDGEEYGIPNIEKADIVSFLHDRNISEERVFLTHGADEIALTILAEIKCRDTGFRPKVFTVYNCEKTAHMVMPYMAVTMSASAEEKLRMLNALPVSLQEDADFSLFLSANDWEEDTLGSRLPSAKQLKRLTAEGKKAAVVDLTRHFSAEEALLPILLRENAPLNSFIAYAGWNTASNSIGTALAQSILFLARQKEVQTKGEALALSQYNLTFLHNRYLEDFYYLKEIIDKVNQSLKRVGYRNT